MPSFPVPQGRRSKRLMAKKPASLNARRNADKWIGKPDYRCFPFLGSIRSVHSAI